MNTKSMQYFDKLSPELQTVIKSIAESIKPILDDIHNRPATTQNYYGDYMRILLYKPEHKKLMSLSMIYAGANVYGIEAALKFI